MCSENKVTKIKNVTALTMNENRDVIKNAVVCFKGNKIIYVGDRDIEETTMDQCEIEVIDGEEGILMPGMINCHTHASMIPFRSLAEDYKDRLKRYLFPLEQRLVNEELTFVGAKYAIAEMLLGGVTTFCDMYYFEDEVAKAARDLNMRGVLCETIVNFPSPDSKEPLGGLEYSRGFINRWKGNNLIIPGVAPHAPYSNTEDSLREAFKISKEYNVPMTMHLAEMDYEFDECKEKYNLTPVQYMDRLGILDSNFISAHTVLVDENDIEILKGRNVGVSHNIGANSKGAKGVMPLIKMMERGIKIGLGSDGPMSGNTLDIITQMSLVGKIHKLVNKDRTILHSVDLIELATIGGARVLGIDSEVGSIEVGKKADLTLIETKSVNMEPIYDHYSAIVYSSNPGNVNTVIVDGVVVVKNKRLVSGDFREIRKNLINLKDRINKVAYEL